MAPRRQKGSTTQTPAESPIPRHERRPRDASYDDVLITPRYLAGSSWSGDDAFVPLTYYYWHDMHDEMGNFYVTTGGSQLRVAFVPEQSEVMPDADALWQIRARSGWPPVDVWSAAFTDDTPPEIIAVITAELDAVVSSDRGRESYLDRGIADDADPATVWEVLRAAGWQVTATERGFEAQAVSPDELVSFAYRSPARVHRGEAWLAQVRPPGTERSLWEAWFHSATPTYVLKAFATGLTDPTPVSREAGSLRVACRAYATPLHPPAPVTEARPVPTPRDLAQKQCRRTGPLDAVSVPRWSTTTGSRRQPPAPTAPPTGPRR